MNGWRAAGRSAEERHRRGLRSWRRRVSSRVGLFALGIGLLGIVPAFFLGEPWRIPSGALVGAAIAFHGIVKDSPPHYVENWHLGALGERSTAKVLRPLAQEGWFIRNDLASPSGNRDHVVIGAAGVFLLESKSPRGPVSIEDGVYTITWTDDPDGGYACPGLHRRMCAAAAELKREWIVIFCVPANAGDRQMYRAGNTTAQPSE